MLLGGGLVDSRQFASESKLKRPGHGFSVDAKHAVRDKQRDTHRHRAFGGEWWRERMPHFSSYVRHRGSACRKKLYPLYKPAFRGWEFAWKTTKSP